MDAHTYGGENFPFRPLQLSCACFLLLNIKDLVCPPTFACQLAARRPCHLAEMVALVNLSPCWNAARKKSCLCLAKRMRATNGRNWGLPSYFLLSHLRKKDELARQLNSFPRCQKLGESPAEAFLLLLYSLSSSFLPLIPLLSDILASRQTSQPLEGNEEYSLPPLRRLASRSSVSPSSHAVPFPLSFSRIWRNKTPFPFLWSLRGGGCVTNVCS